MSDKPIVSPYDPRVTLMSCPGGCGGYLLNDGSYCPACRYAPNEQRIKSDPNWCWQWFGDMSHRMKCRRLVGHTGPCHDHPDSDPDFSVFKLATAVVISRGKE